MRAPKLAHKRVNKRGLARPAGRPVDGHWWALLLDRARWRPDWPAEQWGSVRDGRPCERVN